MVHNKRMGIRPGRLLGRRSSMEASAHTASVGPLEASDVDRLVPRAAPE